MGEYYCLVNHTQTEKLDPSTINRGYKLYQWLSECTGSMAVYLLLNGSYSDGHTFAGKWAGDEVECVGDTKNVPSEYTDIAEEVYDEMETYIKDFPENMDSEIAKEILATYSN